MKQQIKILEDFQEKEWITKTGERVKVKDLKLSHLKNIVKYLKKRFDSLEDPRNDYPSFGGEMAQMAAESEWISRMEIYEQLKKKVKLFEVYYSLKSL